MRMNIPTQDIMRVSEGPLTNVRRTKWRNSPHWPTPSTRLIRPTSHRFLRGLKPSLEDAADPGLIGPICQDGRDCQESVV